MGGWANNVLEIGARARVYQRVSADPADDIFLDILTHSTTFLSGIVLTDTIGGPADLTFVRKGYSVPIRLRARRDGVWDADVIFRDVTTLSIGSGETVDRIVLIGM